MNAVENIPLVVQRNRSVIWLLLSALVVVVDQLSKLYITSHFGEFEFTAVLPVLDITRMHNVGAAFSFLANASGWQRWVFIGLALSVSIAIVVWLVRGSALPAASFAAERIGPGTYRARLVFPSGGRWRYEIADPVTGDWYFVAPLVAG